MKYLLTYNPRKGFLSVLTHPSRSQLATPIDASAAAGCKYTRSVYVVEEFMHLIGYVNRSKCPCKNFYS